MKGSLVMNNATYCVYVLPFWVNAQLIHQHLLICHYKVINFLSVMRLHDTWTFRQNGSRQSAGRADRRANMQAVWSAGTKYEDEPPRWQTAELQAAFRAEWVNNWKSENNKEEAMSRERVGVRESEAEFWQPDEEAVMVSTWVWLVSS